MLLALFIVLGAASCGSGPRRCCVSAPTTPPRSSAPMCFSPAAIRMRCCTSMCRRRASRCCKSHAGLGRSRAWHRARRISWASSAMESRIARPGKGCTVLPDGKLAAAATIAPRAQPPPAAVAASRRAPALSGRRATRSTPTRAIDRILADDRARRSRRARHRRRRSRPHRGASATPRGFAPATPLLGWSMTKTVMAGLIGMLVKDGKLALDQVGILARSSR